MGADGFLKGIQKGFYVEADLQQSLDFRLNGICELGAGDRCQNLEPEKDDCHRTL